MTGSTPHMAQPHACPLGESETVEFKTSLAELKQGLISLVAMLNKHGQADLWFGISPSGKPVGLMVIEKTLRNWRDPDYIQIAIYKNRVEIRNPGGLFDGLTFEEMRRGNVSHRRNPLMADLFRRIDMVEAWGRGMPLILENAPDVAFREIARLFVASFERPSAAVKTTPEIGLTTPETTPEIVSITPETADWRQKNTKERLVSFFGIKEPAVFGI